MKTNQGYDPSIKMALEAFQASGMSLERLGNEMGYTGESARKSAWQFLYKTRNPRVSMLRKFAKAMKMPMQDLV